MNDFKRGGGFGDRKGGDRRNGGFGGNGGFKKSFGGQRSGNFGHSGHSGPREMFDATCSKCNQPCKIPFRPNGSRPVYCNNCFGSSGGEKNNFSRKENFPVRSQFQPNTNEPRTNDIKIQIDAINVKLDKIMEMLRKNSVPQNQIEKAPIKVESLKDVVKKVAPKKGKKIAKKR